MADGRRYELDELVNRPGTYLNPQTEVMVIVDDSQSIDSEIFNMEDFEGADWVLVSDEVPVDEPSRDELLETFQARYGDESTRRGATLDGDEEVAELDGDPEALEDLEER
jgi:hypothetical protein